MIAGIYTQDEWDYLVDVYIKGLPPQDIPMDRVRKMVSAHLLIQFEFMKSSMPNMYRALQVGNEL